MKAEQLQSRFAAAGLNPQPPADPFVGVAERHPGNICTASGRMFDLLNPSPDEIDLDDIAHALSQVNRFTGHTAYPYSVGQHSIYCADECFRRYPDRADWQLLCLLHDAAEAYCGDVSRPLKNIIRATYAPIEDKLQAAVWQHFGLADIAFGEDATGKVHEIDQAVVMAEACQIMVGGEAWAWGDTWPASVEIVPSVPGSVAWLFVSRFHRLYAQVFGKFYEGRSENTGAATIGVDTDVLLSVEMRD